MTDRILTEDEIGEIEARAEKATPGEWTTHGVHEYEIKDAVVLVDRDSPRRWPIRHTYRVDDPEDRAHGFRCTEWIAEANGSLGMTEGQKEANAKFIAASRTDIPALLATIRAKDAEIAAMREVVEAAREWNWNPSVPNEETMIDVIMAYDAKVKEHPATGKLIKICPECGGGDVRWCSISVRPYCNDCSHWAPVNLGTAQDAIDAWNARVKDTTPT